MLVSEAGRVIRDNEIKNKKIIFFGASTRNIIAINDLGIEDDVLFFVDSDKKKEMTTLNGYNVFSVERIKDISDCIIVSVLVRNRKEVLDSVRKIGNNQCFFYIHEMYKIKDIAKNNLNILKKETQYKYIHIFSNDKFIRFFYSMVEDNYTIDEHLFIVDYRIRDKKSGAFDYNDIETRNRRNNNIIVLDSVQDGLEFVQGEDNCNEVFKSEKMSEILENAEKVILHSAYWSSNGKKFVQSLVEKINKKMTWLCWGGDSYFESDSEIVKNILSKIKHAYASKERIKRIKNIYKIPVKDTNATYTYTSIDEQIYMNSLEENSAQKNKINILLGHSAAEYGNHQWGMELLEKYKDENIRIFCPLSYGSEIYRKKVMELGNEKFGDKFVPMINFMEHKEYCTFLNTIDVAVFPLTRMAAGTTLTYLNAIGKKIYMNAEQIKNFSNLNIQAEDITEIKKQNFKEFITYSNLDQKKKIENIKKLNQKVISEWSKIIEDKWEEEIDDTI